MTLTAQQKENREKLLDELVQWETPEHEQEVKTFFDQTIAAATKAERERVRAWIELVIENAEATAILMTDGADRRNVVNTIIKPLRAALENDKASS